MSLQKQTDAMTSTTESNTDDKLEHLRHHVSSAVLDDAELVSKGFFGAVYRVPYDGVLCAAKYRRCNDNRYKPEQFREECLLHSKLHHSNIVRMLGVCYNKLDQPIKIMELLELSLSSVVYTLGVPMYVKLTLLQDISRGLDYLHTCNPPIVHSYLGLGIILLTANLVAKIGGFTFSAEMVPETKRLAEPTTDSFGNKILESSLYCGPPFDIFSFGWLICKTAIGSHCSTIHKFLHSAPIGKLLVIHTVNIGQCDYFINQIEDTSLKQLVMDCMNDNGDLRPSASLINEIIGNMIKGECYLFIKQYCVVRNFH